MEGGSRHAAMGFSTSYFKSSKRYDRATLIEGFNKIIKNRGIRYDDLARTRSLPESASPPEAQIDRAVGEPARILRGAVKRDEARTRGRGVTVGRVQNIKEHHR